MFPGFFLSFLYLIYIIGWAMINPKIAPKLPEEQTKVPVPNWMRKFRGAYSGKRLAARAPALVSRSRALHIQSDQRVTYWLLIKTLGPALVPFAIVAGTLWL